tara:strand:+ start:790 stop:2208 length:1419 start_codon:yes stop_codon:yes gene_type:complete
MSNSPKKYAKDAREKATEASKKMLDAGWGIFGDIKGILKYSDEEEIELVRSTRMFLYTLMGGSILAVFWMAFSYLDVVSMAEGEVTPSSSIKSVQHFEGGIIKEIAVEEGEEVKKGEVLIVLESTASGASVTELASRIASLEADIIRFEAEALSVNGDTVQPQYPRLLRESFPEIAQQSRDVFKARIDRFNNEFQAAREKMRQREQDVREVQARLDNLGDRLEIANEQVAISEDLLRDELTNRYNHLELLREVSVISSSIEEDKAAFQRALSQMEESRANMEGARINFLEDVNLQMEDARSQLAEARERMVKLEDSLRRTQLASPVDGVVQRIAVKTVGGVVKPGEPIVDIVPIGDQLIVEAQLPVSDIGYVKIGQEATVRLDSADAMRFEKLYGAVIFIAPDSTGDEETGEFFYKVKIETSDNKFEGAGGLTYNLYPGMKVRANVVTGRRTILEYVLSPFLEASYESLQER